MGLVGEGRYLFESEEKLAEMSIWEFSAHKQYLNHGKDEFTLCTD